MRGQDGIYEGLTINRAREPPDGDRRAETDETLAADLQVHH
jgi:hypothetical protein